MAKAQAAIGAIKWTNLERVLNEAGDYFIQEARNHLGENRNYASGLLGDSMEKIIEIGEDYYSLSISLQDYWYYVENGRKPGRFPPPNKIEEWVKIKPVTPYTMKNGKLPTTKQLAFLIGRKIAREGTQPHPFFKPAKEDTIAHFRDMIDYAIDADVAVYVEELVLRQTLYEDLFKML